MIEPNIFWSLNIKYLRNRKKLSRGKLSVLSGISVPALRAYENRKTICPTLNDLLDGSQHFSISVDHLLKTNISLLTEPDLRRLESGTDNYLTGRKIRSLMLSPE